MIPDDNWKQTRILAEDMSDLLANVSVEDTETFLKVLESLIVHRFVEETIKVNDFRGKDCEIDLPYLGSLVISIDDKNKMSINFTARKVFERKLRAAYVHHESPLPNTMSKLLGKHLVSKMEDGDISGK